MGNQMGSISAKSSITITEKNKAVTIYNDYIYSLIAIIRMRDHD